MSEHAMIPENADIQKGYTTGTAVDAEALAQETALLKQINARPGFFGRWKGYLTFLGPGFLLSAVALGSGTAGSSIASGLDYGYKLLWVHPVGTILGIIMFISMGKQVLVTNARPYDTIWKRLHPGLALFWAFNVILASTVWQFPQYSLGTAVLKDMLSVIGFVSADTANTTGFTLANILCGLSLLVPGIYMCWRYATGERSNIMWFESTLKYIVWFMVFAFLAVVIKTGVNFGELFKGYFGFYIPTTKDGLDIVMAGLAAAIGVNMTLLYPYSLMARGWGKDHLGLKNADLIFSMGVPSIIATGLIVIVVANSMHGNPEYTTQTISAATIGAKALGPLLGDFLGRMVFNLGVYAMALSSITIIALMAGMAACEMFHIPLQSTKFKVVTLGTSIGFFGAFYSMPFWLPIVTSSANIVMMPLAYICFFLLANRKDFMGSFVNQGFKGWLLNIGMLIAVLVMVLGAAIKIINTFF
jgi:manganese transport protein